MWPFDRKKKALPVEQQTQRPYVPTRTRSYHSSEPTPQRRSDDNGGDFLTGFLVGEALSGGNPTAGLVGGAIGGVTGGIIGAELAPETTNPPAPEFGGGESGGAGASGSWDAPTDPAPPCSDTSMDSSSSSDSSSSCDSGSSSDSGSSGGSDF